MSTPQDPMETSSSSSYSSSSSSSEEEEEEEEEVKVEKQVPDAEKKRVEKKDEATTDEEEEEEDEGEEDDDDDDEDGEEEECKQEDRNENKPMSSKPKSPPQDDAAMETSSSSSSPFSEPQKQVEKNQDGKQDESTTDDDDVEDDHQGTKQEDGNPKCTTSLNKLNNDKGNGKVHENNNKRPLEVAVEEEYSHSERRSKRTQDRQFEAEGSKKLFQRIWDENDELVILKGMIDFRFSKGISPAADFISFREFIKKNLHFDPTLDQVKNKIRRLREKFKRNVKGKGPDFKSQHEFQRHDLSSKIWGDEASKICGDEAPLTTVSSLPLLSSAPEDNLTKISELKKKRAGYEVYLKWLSAERRKTRENVDEIDRQLKGMVDLSE